MGKFDTVKVNYPLPDDPGPEVQALEFQTYSLGDQLNYYEITAEGRLKLVERNEESTVTPEEAERFTGELFLYCYRDQIYSAIREKYEREGLTAETYITAAERNAYRFRYTSTFEAGRLTSISRELDNYPDPVIPTKEEREAEREAIRRSGLVMLDEAGNIPIRGLG